MEDTAMIEFITKNFISGDWIAGGVNIKLSYAMIILIAVYEWPRLKKTFSWLRPKSQGGD